jgi:hypothetical protein
MDARSSSTFEHGVVRAASLSLIAGTIAITVRDDSF